jgi:nitronate monooxygenase
MDVLSFLEHPIIQGPMAGGACTPELVAAVSNAGALGSLAGSMLSPSTLTAQVSEIRALTNRPFLVNFFVQDVPAPDPAVVERGRVLLRPITEKLGWAELPLPKQWCEDFAAQFEALLDLKPALASFTFNILHPAQVQRMHEAGIGVIGTATTVAEAQAWEAAGADAVVASSMESGGHRGTFIGAQEDAFVAAAELWPAAVKAVRIPVIAAGGIMDGHDIRHALASGAVAVQMGTAFLVCDESGIDPLYKQRLLTAQGQPTRLTRSLTGRYARGIENTFMREMDRVARDIPAYPVQNALTGSIRSAAAAKGDTELMSLWAGTGVARSRGMRAARLVETLVAEMKEG